MKLVSKTVKRFLSLALLLIDFPKIIVLNFLIFKTHLRKKMVFLVEMTTTNEFFYLTNVLERLNKEDHLIIIMSGQRLHQPLFMLLKKKYSKKSPWLINSSWFNFFFYLDFYINATLSYDIKVPKRVKRTISFPHTITSKTKYDVFSPAIEKITDMFVPGEVYLNDINTYCRDYNIKKIPQMHKVGSPKSDDLFSHKINKREFIKNIGLEPELPTIFFAPTWNPKAGIFTWLDYILEIPDKHNVNLIIKVHPGAYIDSKNKKSSGGVDWKAFFEADNLRKKRIYNAMNVDSTDFVIASDIAITCISTIWIEYYLLRKKIIFVDIPEFFKDHEKNSLGDFMDTYGYLVKDVNEMHNILGSLLENKLSAKAPPSIDNKLLYNKGAATQAAVDKIKLLFNNN